MKKIKTNYYDVIRTGKIHWDDLVVLNKTFTHLVKNNYNPISYSLEYSRQTMIDENKHKVKNQWLVFVKCETPAEDLTLTVQVIGKAIENLKVEILSVEVTK